MNLMSNFLGTIGYSILGFVTIFLIAIIIFIAINATRRQNALEKLKNFVIHIETEYTKVDTKEDKQIEVLYYHEELFKAKMETIFKPSTFTNGIFIFDNVMDFRKLRLEDPIEPNKAQINFYDEIIVILINDAKVEIKYEDIFYLKGYYEPTKNAVFVKFICYDRQINYRLQIQYFEDIIYINNKILNKKINK